MAEIYLDHFRQSNKSERLEISDKGFESMKNRRGTPSAGMQQMRSLIRRGKKAGRTARSSNISSLSDGIGTAHGYRIRGSTLARKTLKASSIAGRAIAYASGTRHFTIRVRQDLSAAAAGA